MKVSYTFLADGTSDRVLMEIISWSIRNINEGYIPNGEFADFSMLRKPPRASHLDKRINYALKYYPSDLLFIHRDAEKKDGLKIRRKEIEQYIRKSHLSHHPYVFVIPVTMMEAWLLIDEEAIKKAAGNRNYASSIQLPLLRNIETIADPKSLLQDFLLEASGRNKRGRKKMNVHQAIHLVADFTEDFSDLFELPSFNHFYNELEQMLKDMYPSS